jgi:hypothetical protein
MPATIKPGDKLAISANYNSNLHKQMGNDPVMGITHVYIGTD